jgi:transcriptional regulator with XRE-family HTH domain
MLNERAEVLNGLAALLDGRADVLNGPAEVLNELAELLNEPGGMLNDPGRCFTTQASGVEHLPTHTTRLRTARYGWHPDTLVRSSADVGVWAMSLPVKRPPYPFADSVGRQIREARAAQGLSIQKLSKLAKVSRRHLTELEKGSNVTLGVARSAMLALGIAALELGQGATITVPAAARGGTDLLDAAKQLELGAALVLRASATIRTAAGESPPDHQKNGVRNELAENAAALIRHFETHVRGLDTEEQVEALKRLVEASIAPTHDPVKQAIPRKRKASA